MQASLAADFSVTRFCDIKKLIIWHGRLSYKRSASLSQFVVHRGMIISFIQAIFTCLYFFVTIPIYNGYLILGYSTIYTSFPVFSLVLDEDVSLRQVNRFPALYKTIQKGRSLNLKTFLIWTWKSIYQVSTKKKFECHQWLLILFRCFVLGLLNNVRCCHLIRSVICQYRVDHVYDFDLYRDAECAVRSNQDPVQDGLFDYSDSRVLHRQYCTLQTVLPSQLHWWTILAQGDFAYFDHMVPALAVQKSDGKMRPYLGAENHARSWLNNHRKVICTDRKIEKWINDYLSHKWKTNKTKIS